MAKCYICGAETHPEEAGVNYGPEYGIVRLNGRGDLIYEFDVCDDCRPRVLDAIAALKKRD